MKKETLIEIVLGTIGGLIFAIGMTMCLLPEWNLFKVGVVVTHNRIYYFTLYNTCL